MNTRNKMIFRMENVFCLLLSILVGCTQTSAVCDSGEISTSGSKCEYMCHCAGGGVCDASKGHCVYGCEKYWFGPGCQFRDLAEGALSRHLDNMQPHHYAPEANDGDINSCSYTNNATASRGKNPWWRVYFPQTETIWSMEIVTIEAALSYFQGFNVMVEKIPASKRDDSTYYPAEQPLCYKHSNGTPSNTTIHVSCINPLKGNQVRIQLARKDTQLVLCDVKINGACPLSQYGTNCSMVCNAHCKDNCHLVNGTCLEGCESGWKGQICDEECTSGEWGENCVKTCGECLNGTCDSLNGYCLGGCKPGYKDTHMCTEECPVGKYGLRCENNCSARCKEPNNCRKVDGHCAGCNAGKQGAFCDKNCDIGRYGESCLKSCGACDRNETCNIESGYCSKGCSKGYKYSLLCNEGCDDGTHGYNCSKLCGKCKPGSSCDKTTGICLAGCVDGFKPGICMEALPLKDSFQVGGVIGGVIASLTVITGIAVVLILIRRRKKQNEPWNSKPLKLSANSEVNHADIEHEQAKKKESHELENIYMNSDILQIELKHSRELDVQKQTVCDIATISEQLEDDDTGVYCNEERLSRHKTEHSVCVMDLQAYVKKKLTENNGFTKEFEVLPSGLQHPTTVAKKVENIGKNRYKALYAYDYSRVVLKCLPEDPGSDYINASYIKGYNKDIAYIASQGPVENNIDDFWRMIWEKDMKCKQYWPEVGDVVHYGTIYIQTESEDVNAEFQIRRLKVSKEDKTVRNIIHFHYMAWPDKGVPRSTSSLLNFWYQVRKSDEMKSHTWVIHCSAGVGRTGTLIAIDFLYDQGVDQGWIDIYQCVHDLRDQRVCMVQTEEQYRFLHSVLVEAFLLPWKPIHADSVPRVYKQLQEIDQKTGKTNILLEYECSLAETNDGKDLNKDDDIYTSAKHTENRRKNRYDNILAPNDYRPFLFTQVEGCTNYINAIYMPSYSDLFGYILTQTPLPNTVIDCCRLVFEQEVNVIITFEEDVGSDEETGIYLPDNGEIHIGPFTVVLVSTEDKIYTTLKRYRLEFESKEHRLTELVCKQWPSKELAPIDPKIILTFLQNIERLQMEVGRKPVLAQCLNGAERSGLIVVLMNILERMRLTNEVSVPQVIRQMRIRRQQIIPNYEQYRFCYEVLQSYVDNNAVYANV